MSWRRGSAVLVAVMSLLASLFVGTGAAVGADSIGLVAASPGHYSAVIRRTEYGIPHILAANFGGLGYGYGYAFAQDNLCSLADLVLTVDGGRSRYFGPKTDAGDPLVGPLSNLDSDTYHRSVNDSGVVQRTMNQPAPLGLTAQLRDLVNGYAAGVNRYLTDTGVANLPDPTCRAKPWVHPISTTELERILYYITQFGGETQFQSQIANASPAAGKPTAGTLGGMAAAFEASTPDLGSNGIGVGKDGTAHGDGLLLANPHFPWLGSGRFYQVQLTIPGVLDVTGASLDGTPLVEIGHNANLAWTHTVSTSQRFTLYELHLLPGDPTSYLVDGRAERMTSRTVSVPVTGGGTVTRTVYDSRYGPVLNEHPTATTALAIRGASVNNGRSANEWLAMGRAGNIAALHAAQNRFQGIPFTNTIAADATGTTYFADASVVPHVSDAQAARCVDSPFGKSLYPGVTVLDGSTSDCAWGSDPDAITPGIFGPHTDPTLTRTDFVTNSNNSSWLTNPAAPITGLPAIYGPVNTPRSLRTRMGLELIDQRLHGTDGLGAPGFTVATTQQLLLSDRNLSAELARDAMVSLCRANPTLTASDGKQIDVRAACPVLAGWNLRDDPDSRGAVLWRQYWLGAQGATDVWSVPFDPAHPASTPNTLNPASAGVRRALADAVERMNALHVPLEAALSAAQYTNVGGPDVAVPGGTNAEGGYNIVTSSGSPALGNDGRFSPIVEGSSFIMAVELSPAGPSARTILTYSESTNPDSPHHNDQTVLFAAKKWVTERFTEHDIATDPQLSIIILIGR